MSKQAFLIDLDGVLYVGDSPVPGAAETIAALKKKGYNIRFLSNTTRKSRKTIVDRLGSMGFDIGTGEVFTPAVAAIAYIKKTGISGVHLLTTGDVDKEFAESGIFSRSDGVEAVVVGDAGDNFSYERMNSAFRFLLEGAALIALEKDRYWMAEDGLMLSAGPFVSALEYATGNVAVVMGKPSRTFFELALDSMGAGAAEAAMIGDDVITDIGGAIRCGMRGILVRTGKFRPETLQSAEMKPTAVIPSIAHLETLL